LTTDFVKTQKFDRMAAKIEFGKFLSQSAHQGSRTSVKPFPKFRIEENPSLNSDRLWLLFRSPTAVTAADVIQSLTLERKRKNEEFQY